MEKHLNYPLGLKNLRMKTVVRDLNGASFRTWNQQMNRKAVVVSDIHDMFHMFRLSQSRTQM